MASSEITQVLANTLSAEDDVRNAAEQQLAQASESNFPLYLATLVQELANDQSNPAIRSAAGLTLKNTLNAKDAARQLELTTKWLQGTDDETRARVKQLTLQSLSAQDRGPSRAAAQIISCIAVIELPRSQWNELLPVLVQNVSEGADHLKQASLTAIGFICDNQDPELRLALVAHSNAILTAVVQGARKEEVNPEVRLAAINALGDSLDFVGNNFKHDGERNYIMQVVCEATQAEDGRIQQGAFGCLNRIMGLYYENMRFYMEKALFGLTILGMKNDDEDVAKLAVEFWCTVCEEEINAEEENAQIENAEQMRAFYNFARVAAGEVVPVLLSLLTKQDEDAGDDEYNISHAAYQCLQLYSQAVGGVIVAPVLQFVEQGLRHEDWHQRDASVSAFGAIMEGPDEKVLDPIVRQALPILITMMDDPSMHVKDSTAYTLGRIIEACSEAIDPQTQLPSLIESLFKGLLGGARMAPHCCWALVNLAERFTSDPSSSVNPLTPHFNQAVSTLLDLTEQSIEITVRTAAYEVLNVFAQNAAADSLPAVASLSEVITKRLENTVPMQNQVVSSDDKRALEELQNSLCSVLEATIGRLDKEIAPQADRIMQVLLLMLSSLGNKSSVPDNVFRCVSALAGALEEDFVKYMDAFAPYLYNALGNQDEPSLCSIAIGLVSDMARSLGERSQPYCDQFMNYLLNNLRSSTLADQFKPAILDCFSDIAVAIGGHFETYLAVVAQVLQQASTVMAPADGPYEQFDYVISLRRSILDAWDGIIGAMRASGKSNLLQPFVTSIFELLNLIATDLSKSESLMLPSMGVIGGLAESFPNGELVDVFRQDWLTQMIKETKTNREYQQRTIETARWARELIKRQVGGAQTVMSTA